MIFKLRKLDLFDKELSAITKKDKLIVTLNAHSYNLGKINPEFRMCLSNANILLPDGISVVWAKYFLDKIKLKKIAGADLFAWEMQRLNAVKGTCFFLGSNNKTLDSIKLKAAIDYPHVNVFSFSPPYKNQFSDEDNEKMLGEINTVKPNVLFVGMTAPKQEIWAYENKQKISAEHICCIGAVFDFYAGTVKRAPRWMIKLGLEWLYRFLAEPKRLWKRYLLGNFKFIYLIFKEKLSD